MAATQRETNPDHKFKAVRVAYQAQCKCGWESGMIYGGKFGAGGRSGAYAEWHAHREKCEAVEAKP